MSEMVSIENAEHYMWGNVCDGWHLLRGENLSVIEERMPPGAEEQRHFHTTTRQFFYVLAGELTMEVDGRFHTLQPRQGLEIAPRAAASGAEPVWHRCSLSCNIAAAQPWGSSTRIGALSPTSADSGVEFTLSAE